MVSSDDDDDDDIIVDDVVVDDDDDNDDYDLKIEKKANCHCTVKPGYTGPKSNGNLPITNGKPRSHQVISFNFLYWK